MAPVSAMLSARARALRRGCRRWPPEHCLPKMSWPQILFTALPRQPPVRARREADAASETTRWSASRTPSPGITPTSGAGEGTAAGKHFCLAAPVRAA